MPTARFTIETPLTIPARRDGPMLGKTIEVDGWLQVEVEYDAKADSAEVLRMRSIEAIDGAIYVGLVKTPSTLPFFQELAAEWWIVAANREFARAKCEADRLEWLRKNPPKRAFPIMGMLRGDERIGA